VRFPLFSTALVLLAGVFGAAIACGHEPLEITTDVRVRAEGITIIATMARSTAFAACSEGKSAPRVFDPAEFETLRKRFVEHAGALFEISVAGKTLAPREVTAALTVENDVEFHFVYPPATAAAPLRIRAPFLKTLPPDGYGAMLTAYSGTGMLLGQQLLTVEEPACELAVP
jgi:hypothetical protein